MHCHQRAGHQHHPTKACTWVLDGNQWWKEVFDRELIWWSISGHRPSSFWCTIPWVFSSEVCTSTLDTNEQWFLPKEKMFLGKIQAESDSKAATVLNNCLDVIVIQQVGAESPKEWYFCHPLPLLSPFGAHVVFGAHMSSLSSMHQLPRPPPATQYVHYFLLTGGGRG